MVKKILSKEEREILLAEYETVNFAAIDEGQQAWTRFQAFLVFNTILGSFIAAIILFSANQGFGIILYVILLLISFVGMGFSWAWIVMKKRGSAVYDYWFSRLRAIESQLGIAKSFRYMNVLAKKGWKLDRFGKRFGQLKGLAKVRTRNVSLPIIWAFFVIWLGTSLVSLGFLLREWLLSTH